MIGYVLMYKGKYIGVYKTYAKALLRQCNSVRKMSFSCSDMRTLNIKRDCLKGIKQ